MEGLRTLKNVRQKLGTRNFSMFECSEQLLFSCVSSKVIVCHAIYHMSYFTYHMSNVKCLGSKVTVYSRKLQWFFWDSSITLSCESRVDRAGSQLKIITKKARAIVKTRSMDEFSVIDNVK